MSDYDERRASAEEDPRETPPAAGDALETIDGGDAQVVEDAIERVLDGNVSPEHRPATARFVAWSHRGPLPDPETLAQYDFIYPGAAKDIIEMAKMNQAHRMQMDHRDMDCRHKIANTARLSLGATWSVLVIAFIFAGYLASKEQYLISAILGTAGLAPMVQTLIRGNGGWSGNAAKADEDEEDKKQPRD